MYFQHVFFIFFFTLFYLCRTALGRNFFLFFFYFHNRISFHLISLMASVRAFFFISLRCCCCRCSNANQIQTHWAENIVKALKKKHFKSIFEFITCQWSKSVDSLIFSFFLLLFTSCFFRHFGFNLYVNLILWRKSKRKIKPI